MRSAVQVREQSAYPQTIINIDWRASLGSLLRGRAETGVSLSAPNDAAEDEIETELCLNRWHDSYRRHWSALVIGLFVFLRSCFHVYFLFSLTASLALWLRRPPRGRKIPGSNSACPGIFFGCKSYR